MKDEAVSSWSESLHEDTACSVCGFVLWEPIAVSEASRLGLYNDDRFPGRCILVFREHVESLEGISGDAAGKFLQDIQTAMAALREATGAERVNVAILGNRVPHLHAHLIPRFPEQEEFPDCSPWNDLREKNLLPADAVRVLKADILACLQQ